MLSPNHEWCIHSRSAGPGLAATHTDSIAARRSESNPGFIHHAQIPRAQTDLHVTHLTFRNVDPRKSDQRTARRTAQFWKSQINLDDLVSVPIARVGYVYIHTERFAFVQFRGRKLQIAV